MATFKERMKTLRKENNLTLEELAEKIKSTKSTLSRYENGGRKPRADLVHILANFFNVSADYLVGLTDDPTPRPTLSQRDERDIAKELESTMDLLKGQEGLMFDGAPMDEETKELLRQSLENAMRFAKISNKKYTPKKYREE